jgi:hypothetical protein
MQVFMRMWGYWNPVHAVENAKWYSGMENSAAIPQK